MSRSVNTAIDSIVTLLQGYTALTTLCTTNYGKAATITRKFRKRTEVGLSELPVIMITRPAVKKSYLVNARSGIHTMRFYCGFHQPDIDLAQQQIVEIEETIDDGLLSVPPETLELINLTPVASENDEGYFHPVYFLVMDVELHHRRYP